MHTALMWIITLAAFIVFGWRFWVKLRPLTKARALSRSDQPMLRLQGVFGDIGLHRRLLNIRFSGALHLMIFLSFIVLFSAIVQAFGSGLFPGFSLVPLGGETWIASLQEIFSIIILIGLAMACWQRFVVKPARFKGSSQTDATVIYLLVITIVVTMLLEYASTNIVNNKLEHSWRPVSSFIARLLSDLGMDQAAAESSHQIFYWLHILAILSFLVYIPGSKHRHMFLAAPNIFFRPLTPKGQLPAPHKTTIPSDKQLDEDQIAVNNNIAVVKRYSDFTWKDLLDTLSCTECGRCQAVCPAHAAGTPLSPKTLIMNLRDGMLADQNLVGDELRPTIAGDTITAETLWSCTTCGHCMEVCPIHIEHVPKIVQLRRSLVEEGAVEPMLQTALIHFQAHGNSFGRPSKQRARWTKGLSFKIKDARKTPVDILWFVGDFASFDPRVQKLTVTVGELLNRAGVDFGILYDAECNSGNDVRRAGDEGLFEILAQQNIDTLNGCQFNRIMTTDPHSLNALGSDYRTLGAEYNVVHYSQLLLELVRSGSLQPKQDAGVTVTYHDPCYLGRYNGGFDAPRELLASMGHTLHDMKRSRENSFCCGAGGGRIWMDDSGVTERPSENRIREALALGEVSRFVVSCPKDVVMYNAAIQTLGVEDKLIVCDLAELVAESVETAT